MAVSNSNKFRNDGRGARLSKHPGTETPECTNVRARQRCGLWIRSNKYRRASGHGQEWLTIRKLRKSCSSCDATWRSKVIPFPSASFIRCARALRLSENVPRIIFFSHFGRKSATSGSGVSSARAVLAEQSLLEPFLNCLAMSGCRTSTDVELIGALPKD